MLLKGTGTRESSGGIETSKNLIRLRRVVRNLQCCGGTVLRVWRRSPQRSKILNLFCKNNLILSLFDKIYAFEIYKLVP